MNRSTEEESQDSESRLCQKDSMVIVDPSCPWSRYLGFDDVKLLGLEKGNKNIRGVHRRQRTKDLNYEDHYSVTREKRKNQGVINLLLRFVI